MVLKIYTGGHEPVGHIIDYLAPDEAELKMFLANEALKYFTVEGIETVNCWAMGDLEMQDCLRQSGFLPRTWPTYFGVRVIDDRNGRLGKTLDRENWYITMGDSDVF